MAWFAHNKDVDAKGMAMEVEADSNLVISTSKEDIRTSMNFTITFEGSREKLRAATHDWGVGTQTGLKYNNNPDIVSATSGLAEEGELTFAPVPIRGADPNIQKLYYRDYIVYVASTERPMIAEDLTVTLGYLGGSTPSEEKDYFKAASVDFYVSTASEATYRGTLNLAHQDYRNESSEPVDSISLKAPGEATMTIPYNKAETDYCIPVVMRFYFDGGLKKDDNNTYVYSEGLSTEDFNMAVKFNAVSETK
uniref:Uncharacterized protein n=1 Tax=uncultured bacterium fosmid pJB39A3 TaxID=1478063 RepID=A0A0H3UAF1_9BACT|nr:hypothetical protein [uncultured bacterium fosmid pJB39A3]